MDHGVIDFIIIKTHICFYIKMRNHILVTKQSIRALWSVEGAAGLLLDAATTKAM